MFFLKKNKTRSKKLIFRIGIDAGFFSEYNNMIFTYHYCLVNNIKFVLNSNDCNFSFDKGWQDYFLPFTLECNTRLNRRYNNRSVPPLIIRQKDKLGFGLFLFWLILKRINYVTWQILPEAQKQDLNHVYSISNLGIRGTLFENCREINKRIWRFQPWIKEEIERIKGNLKLPSEYIGFHIRRGDKENESKLVPIVKYIETAESYSEIRKAFIATDDFKVIEELLKKFKSWKFYFLAKEIDHGYFQNVQEKKSKVERRSNMIRLFTEIEILSGSEMFFGTYSSNVSLYIAWRLNREKCIGIDNNEWKVLI